MNLRIINQLLFSCKQRTVLNIGCSATYQEETIYGKM